MQDPQHDDPWRDAAPGAEDETRAQRLYEELRELARREMESERVGHTLQPTALVNEAYLRLASDPEARFENRAHFFASAATAIRRVLVDHARRRGRLRRGGARARIDLDELEPEATGRDEMVLALDEALAELGRFAPQQARIVELRYFAGMTIPEAARVLGVSETTVQRDWRLARAWLRGELEERGDGP